MKNKESKPVLSCTDLAVGYGDKNVLSGLNLTAEPGQFISLLGPNGAGKTTLLRTFSRHLKPLSGSIKINGQVLEKMAAMDLARFMAVVLTEKVAPPLFTVFEFVALGRYPHTNFLGRMGPADAEAVNSALDAVHAGNLADRPFSDLSDGERQKALVARALAQEPHLLLLDEPTLHLDLKHRMEVMTILRNLCHQRAITVLASLHDVDVASKVSDWVALIKDGGMSGWGLPETVLTGRAVADLYDFKDARFSSRLGGIEFSGNGSTGRAFVLAGCGTGAGIYRMLSKRGFAISTGVLYSNDVDYYVARSLGADCLTQPPGQTLNGIAMSEALDRLEDCQFVIDCGVDCDPMNNANQKILAAALKKKKPVFSLRLNNKDNIEKTDIKNSLIYCRDAGELLEALHYRILADDLPEKSDSLQSASYEIKEA